MIVYILLFKIDFVSLQCLTRYPNGSILGYLQLENLDSYLSLGDLLNA